MDAIEERSECYVQGDISCRECRGNRCGKSDNQDRKFHLGAVVLIYVSDCVCLFGGEVMVQLRREECVEKDWISVGLVAVKSVRFKERIPFILGPRYVCSQWLDLNFG